MKQVETRVIAGGLRRRTYIVDEGVRYRTIEVPESVVNRWGSRFQEDLVVAEKKLKREIRNAKIRRMRAEGEKLEVIASEVHITPQAVSMILKKGSK